jgi:hypothetical protein
MSCPWSAPPWRMRRTTATSMLYCGRESGSCMWLFPNTQWVVTVCLLWRKAWRKRRVVVWLTHVLGIRRPGYLLHVCKAVYLITRPLRHPQRMGGRG